MADLQPGHAMLTTAQARQQVPAGMITQPPMASQAPMASQPPMAGQPLTASRPTMAMQPGSSPGPGVYAQQVSMQLQAGLYPGMAQAYPSSAAEQRSCPMSPPDLPLGPSQPATASQIKPLSRQFLGTQMIRPAAATNPIMHNGEMRSLFTLPYAYAPADHATSLLIRHASSPHCCGTLRVSMTTGVIASVHTC